MKATVKRIEIPHGSRIICVSDIHGSLDLFKRLLRKVGYGKGDTLILLGDLYTKGKQGHETLRFIIKISRQPNVHILRGNCDRIEKTLTEAETAWLENLPHILTSEEYIFVHGGLTSDNLEEQDAAACMKNDAFMEKGLKFEKYVITGHEPTVNYTHTIPCFNPIIDREKHIVSIDGGAVIKEGGQLNAFMIEKGDFSFAYVDDFPVIKMEKPQTSCGGDLNITWNDRFVERIEVGEEYTVYRHLYSGKTILLPNGSAWEDGKGNLCICDLGTDYYLPVNAGEAISIVRRFPGILFAKKNGVAGWINTER